MRRRTLLIGAAVVALAGTTGMLVVRNRDVGEAASTPPADDTPKLHYTKADQRDLTRSEDFDGRVGHGTQTPLKLGGNGMLTGLPKVGDVVTFGHQLAEVDGEPVLLLQGDRPAWRELGPNTSDGEDVRQLETALFAMGYADPEDMPVDDEWTAATTAAVKAMQAWNGMPVDGRLSPNEIVFSPTTVRIAEVGGSLGDDAGAAGIEVSDLNQSIEATVKSSKIKLFAVGDTLTVTLPNDDEVDGAVVSIGDAKVGEDGSVTFPVEISTDALDVADGTQVDITVDTVSAKDATAVPADTILALAEGGYAVEVPDSTSVTGTKLVGVELGEFADGWVQITGDVKPGDQVVVP
jgi:hypothetical protein